MIKRVSMWRLKDKAEVARMKEALLSMKGQVPSLLSIEVGVNTSTHKSALDVVFIGTFSNAAALMEFETDSYHLTIGELVGKLTKERDVVEYEV